MFTKELLANTTNLFIEDILNTMKDYKIVLKSEIVKHIKFCHPLCNMGKNFN